MTGGKKGILEGKICPRCGEPFTYLEKRTRGNNVYLYCVHESRKGGKRTIRKCYIGPEEGYIHGSLFNRGILMLRSPLVDQRADIKYALDVLRYLKENSGLTPDEEKAIETVESVIRRVERRREY